MIKMRTGVSRYDVRADGDYGFVVSGLDRQTLRVFFDMESFTWRRRQDGVDWQTGFWLFSYRPLVAEIAREVMSHWTPPEPRMEQRWVLRAVARGINTRVHQQWLRIKDNLPQHYVEVERLLWSVNMHGGGSITVAPQLWARPDLVADILRYRAARLALAHLSAEELSSFDWRASYAFEGKPYRALNLTLDHLPGRLEYLPRELNCVKLERPISDRLELGCLLIYVTTGFWHEQPQRHLHLFMHARHADLVRAIQMTGAYHQTKLGILRLNDLREMVQLAADYPFDHSGNIVGLIQRSIDYHRQMREAAERETALMLADTTPVILPPILLPTDPDIKFLATAGAIRTEGMEMGHCVGRPEMGYIRKAMQGLSFIFSVLHKGERVTVEVGDTGSVRQVQGMDNEHNDACEWARNTLNTWGRKFPNASGGLYIQSATHELIDAQIYLGNDMQAWIPIPPPAPQIAYAEWDLNEGDIQF